MEEVQTLLYAGSSSEQKIIAANTVITNYVLPFNTDDIIKAFNYLQTSQMLFGRMTAIMHLSLTQNLRMFIAIMYALLDNKMPLLLYADLVIWSGSPTYELGCTHRNISNVKTALRTWSALYDYYEFDISELTFSNAMREGLQKHIDSKVINIKRAIK